MPLWALSSASKSHLLLSLSPVPPTVSAQWLALTALAESGDAAANLYGGKNNQLKVTFRNLSAVHRRVDPNGVPAAIDKRMRAMYSRLS
ncbi:hypothetical protein B0H19DRAFT_1271669 [Mycena capillaripes]|nr:hypothetical protein B0H19DRAFT_1271669 [Mycena capillaripes]